MMNPPNRKLWIKLATVGAIVALPASAVAADRLTGRDGSKAKAPIAAGASRSEPPNLDVRRRTATRDPRTSGTRKAQARLRRSIGPRGVLRVSRVTGTPLFVANQDGFLTGRQAGSARQIALRYLRRHVGAFGLDRDDRADLRVYKQYTTRRGLTHIEWNQVFKGIPAFDNVVRANVKGGRLITVSGAPEPDLSV